MGKYIVDIVPNSTWNYFSPKLYLLNEWAYHLCGILYICINAKRVKLIILPSMNLLAYFNP